MVLKEFTELNKLNNEQDSLFRPAIVIWSAL